MISARREANEENNKSEAKIERQRRTLRNLFARRRRDVKEWKNWKSQFKVIDRFRAFCFELRFHERSERSMKHWKWNHRPIPRPRCFVLRNSHAVSKAQNPSQTSDYEKFIYVLAMQLISCACITVRKAKENAKWTRKEEKCWFRGRTEHKGTHHQNGMLWWPDAFNDG